MPYTRYYNCLVPLLMLFASFIEFEIFPEEVPIMVKASQLAMPGLFAVPNQISGLQEKKLKGTLFFFVYTPTNRLVSVMLLCLRRSAFD